MNTKKGLPEKELSRRTFCKNATIAAGGGMLLSSLPLGAGAYAGGSDKLKIAVIGCGGRGTGAAHQALSADPGVELVAMADAFRDRLDDCYNNLHERYGDTGRLNVPEEHKFTGFDGYRHAIELADVVLLTATPGFRPAHFEAAVKAGKHIFAEKPLATDVPGVRQVLEAGREAQRKNLNVVVGLQRRYQDNYRETIRRIRDREIGKIVSGQVYWNSAGVWVRARQPEMSEMEYQMRNWYYFVWLCGDHILEQHIHQIDTANWFIGEYPVSAQGMGGRQVRTGKDHGEIYDHHFVEFTYPGGAVIASQCRHQPGCMNRVSETFQGTAGTVDIDGSHNAVMRDYNGIIRYDHDGSDDPNPYQQEHDEMFASIRRGDVINDTEFGAKSTMTAIMGRMATYSGQVIEWEDAINSDIRLVPDNPDWTTEPPSVPDENGNYEIPIPGSHRVV